MKKSHVSVLIFALLCASMAFGKEEPRISDSSQTCIECHSQVTPGIVASWRKSLHAHMTPAQALKKDEMHGGLTGRNIPGELKNTVVGCAECHTLNPKTHADSFEHNGAMVHVVVTPKDCAVCHKKEAGQFTNSVMGKAYANLMANPTYMTLVNSVNHGFGDPSKAAKHAAMVTKNSCLECHGTKVTVTGKVHRQTEMGDMDFPKLSGWPNAGVGRVNPDGSTGSCTACHTRHDFSIAEARSPAACERCHKGPDVPASKVYKVSKHGTIYSSSHKHWDMTHKPWVAGKDFAAPTCATCHISGVVDPNGATLVSRNHDAGARLSERIFGLPFSHPQTAVADTSAIKNKAGLHLITNLDGSPVKGVSISPKEQKLRRNRMKKLCLNCHSTSWVDGHFKKIDEMNAWADKMVLKSTKLMTKAWKLGLADPKNPFDEHLEKLWVETWLFYANSVRFATAMAGADYGVFAHGSWYLSRTIAEMADWIKVLLNSTPQASKAHNSSKK